MRLAPTFPLSPCAARRRTASRCRCWVWWTASPDIVVAGINRGENMGQDLTYSGTVSAALEAAIGGIPAVAFSLAQADAGQPSDYRVAARVAKSIAAMVLQHGLPPYTILNVNVPPVRTLDDLRGIRLTRQGVRIYRDSLVEVERGRRARRRRAADSQHRRAGHGCLGGASRLRQRDARAPRYDRAPVHGELGGMGLAIAPLPSLNNVTFVGATYQVARSLHAIMKGDSAPTLDSKGEHQ